MLARMYSRYAERRGYKVELLEQSEGEVAGIKSCSIRFDG
jgi:peptide chain release factor 2